MLSIRDCLDYCDLTEDAVALIAEHEGIPNVSAAQIVCGLVQTREGVLLLTNVMDEVMERAERYGDSEQFARVRSVRARFMSDHPVSH